MKLRTRITIALVLAVVIPLVVTTARVMQRGSEQLWKAALNFQTATGDGAVRAVRQRLETSQSELLSIGAMLAESTHSGSSSMRCSWVRSHSPAVHGWTP
ncbi:MAG: hypothetical protein ACI9OJ_001839 [Myxococcota bacterium]|jgi:hypothetical protein